MPLIATLITLVSLQAPMQPLPASYTITGQLEPNGPIIGTLAVHPTRGLINPDECFGQCVIPAFTKATIIPANWSMETLADLNIKVVDSYSGKLLAHFYRFPFSNEPGGKASVDVYP